MMMRCRLLSLNMQVILDAKTGTIKRQAIQAQTSLAE